MLAAALIVFRETLEAAMIVAILAAASRGVRGRRAWIGLGLMAGAAGAGVVALLADVLGSALEGAGQDILNAAILFTATIMIAWHIVWMAGHGRAMAGQMKAVGAEIAAGERHMSMLALVIGLAIMREGSEVVLMLQGLVTAASPENMALGAGLGLFGGAVVGLLMYAGFLVLPVRRVFACTNVLLALIAAGLAARGANCLVQAGWLPDLGPRLWDTSGYVSDASLGGQFLAAMTGYIAHPSGAQVVSYGVTLAAIVLLLAAQKIRFSSRGISV